jgi:hypothetical protein
MSRSFSGRLVERHISVSSASDNARANSDGKNDQIKVHALLFREVFTFAVGA